MIVPKASAHNHAGPICASTVKICGGSVKTSYHDFFIAKSIIFPLVHGYLGFATFSWPFWCLGAVAIVELPCKWKSPSSSRHERWFSKPCLITRGLVLTHPSWGFLLGVCTDIVPIGVWESTFGWCVDGSFSTTNLHKSPDVWWKARRERMSFLSANQTLPAGKSSIYKWFFHYPLHW